MLGICRKARLQRVWPADLLKPGWDVGVIQIGMITAVTADDLEEAGVVACAGISDPGRLPPQARCPAMAGLSSRRQWHGIVGVGTGPAVTGITPLGRSGDGTQMSGRSGTRHDIRLIGTTHFSPSGS
jgi:hypothetical protein